MADIDDLLRRPAVIAAVGELGVSSLGLEDVLAALRRFGSVSVEVADDAALPYACVLEVAGEDPERARGTTVLHAAVGCWAAALEGFRVCADRGMAELEHFLGLDDRHGDAA